MILERLAQAGASFTLCGTRSKTPIGKNWQHRPQTLEGATRHLAKRGNVGILCGEHSHNIIALDIDERFPEFIAEFPHLADNFISWRDNAPERGKVAVKITDRLPRSAKWKPEGSKKPVAELLSTGNQAVIAGEHETGVPILSNSAGIVEMSFADVSAIWRKWTGEELPDPTAPKCRSKPQERSRQSQKPFKSNTFKDTVKAAWTAFDVFEHHGYVAGTEDEQNGDIRLLGNGGLVVGNPDGPKPWRWYCYAEGTGGDEIDAWAYCTNRSRADFTIVLREMAEVKGIEVKFAPVTLNTREGPTDLDFHDAIAVLCHHFNQLDVYPLSQAVDGRPLTQRRRVDRDTMMAFLDAAERTGRLHDIKLDARSAGEASNMTKDTACKAMRRLCRAGILHRAQGESWFTDELLEDDRHIANVFDAHAYTLDLEEHLFGVMTVQYISAVDMYCHNSEQITLRNEYIDHDAFAWGAKLAGTDGESLGKAALDVIAVLSECNDLTYADIAEHSEVSRSTISKKARALEKYGLVEIYKVGRVCFVYLVDNWRERLALLWQHLNTFCGGLKRRISHLRERIARAENFHAQPDSGRLRIALYEILSKWRRRLRELNQRLGRLTKIFRECEEL